MCRGVWIVPFLVPGVAAAADYDRIQVGPDMMCLHWRSRTFEYRVDSEGSPATTGDTEFDAIDRAYASWQAVSDTCSDMKFVRGPRISSPRVSFVPDAGNEN